MKQEYALLDTTVQQVQLDHTNTHVQQELTGYIKVELHKPRVRHVQVVAIVQQAQPFR